MNRHTTQNILLFIVSCGTIFNFSYAQQKEKKIELFSVSDVKLKDDNFLPAQLLNKKYVLELDADKLLAPFLREAGLSPKKTNYTNWENSGLDGHIGGHYISALSLLYAATKDADVYNKLDYSLKELKNCQDNLNTGYIGGVPGSKQLWDDVFHGKIKAGGFDLNNKWVPLYNIHKIFAGLRDAYQLAGREDAKLMLIKLTDWAVHLVSQLSEAQIQDMLRSEHGGLNEVFADVYVITRDKKYLRLAEQFTHQQILNPLINFKDELTGKHANTQIPKIIGAKRIADIENNKDWDQAAQFFWDNVVSKRSVVIGGNSSNEHFHPTNNFSNMITSIEGPETCNTYNMMKLSTQFYQSNGDIKYIDYYERAMYNHILSSQHPEHGGLVYFTPMRPSHYRVYSQPHTSFWCCVGSGIENHSKYGELIYAHRNNELFVNLFVSSDLDWKEKKVKVLQKSLFPNEGNVDLTIEPEKTTNFVLKVRYPSWVNHGHLQVWVNGKAVSFEAQPTEYISISRKWQKGDQVKIRFDVPLYVDQMPDNSSYYSYRYGPLVLAAKTNTDNMTGLLADDSRGGHIAKGDQIPLSEIPHLVSNVADLDEKIEMIAPRDLRFRLKNLYQQEQKIEMELIPFYKLHDSRYIVYWPKVASKEELAQKMVVYEADVFNKKLNAITLDLVNCGQQQSESDHKIKYEESIIGADDGIQWRSAQGWFSYELNNKNRKAKVILIGLISDDSQEFDVFINDNRIKIDKSALKNSISFQGEIPNIADEKLTIVLKAKKPNSIPKIKDIRLLTENYKF